MTATRREIEALLDAHGWMSLVENGPRVTWFRWMGGPTTTRIELTILFDRGGRVSAWSEWHNTRVAEPDQSAGNRDRLERRVSKP